MKTQQRHDLIVEERAQLGQLLASLDERDWLQPSGCPGWSVRDILAHLVAWDDLLLHSSRLGYVTSLLRCGFALEQDAPRRVGRDQATPRDRRR